MTDCTCGIGGHDHSAHCAVDIEMRKRPRTTAARVRQFHEAFGLVIRDAPTVPCFDERALRARLLREEHKEARKELRDPDARDHGREHIAAVAGELADLVYVAYGAALHYGFDLDAAIEANHGANMRKLWSDGKPRHRDDGKVLKPPDWEPADVAEALGL